MTAATNGMRATSNGRRRAASKKVVVFAGGRGTRLAPYTSVLPKPLMPIGDRSILEIVVDQLTRHGFTDITFCVGYLSHLIRAVFDQRVEREAQITYVQEETALGTAAPMRLVEGIDGTFIAMNGDVLTTLDYRDLLRRHRRSGNILTIATQNRMTTHDYGILHLDGARSSLRRVTGYEEKPEIASSVSMGIYVLEPEALSYIPPETHFDFPDLVHALLNAGEAVGAYLYDGLWFDIGRHEDYELAGAAWAKNGHATRGNPKNGRAR
jgi:NDP-sugar pyrophosphorylase family protein